MNGSMRYQTVETSRSIFEQLHLDDREVPYFACTLQVPIPSEDSVEDGVLLLYIDRVFDRPEDFTSANNDLLYNTLARRSDDDGQPFGESFTVTVVIRARQASIASATVSISDEVENTF